MDEHAGWLWSPVAEGEYRPAVPVIVAASSVVGAVVGGFGVLAALGFVWVCFDLPLHHSHYWYHPDWPPILLLGLPHLVAAAVVVRCSFALSTRGSWLPAAVVTGLSGFWALEAVVGLTLHVHHDLTTGSYPHLPWRWAAAIVACATCSAVSLLSWPACWALDRERLEMDT